MISIFCIYFISKTTEVSVEAIECIVIKHFRTLTNAVRNVPTGRLEPIAEHLVALANVRQHLSGELVTRIAGSRAFTTRERNKHLRS